MAELELGNCPFCGSNANEVKEYLVRRNMWYYVQCYECGYESECFRTKEEAEEAWNRRANNV